MVPPISLNEAIRKDSEEHKITEHSLKIYEFLILRESRKKKEDRQVYTSVEILSEALPGVYEEIREKIIHKTPVIDTEKNATYIKGLILEYCDTFMYSIMLGNDIIEKTKDDGKNTDIRTVKIVPMKAKTTSDDGTGTFYYSLAELLEDV